MIRRAAVVLIAVVLVLLSAFAQTPATLPGFSAEALSGRRVAMPEDAKGKPALLVIGFTHASGPHCTDWAKRLETEFKSDASLELYSVIFLEDAPKLFRGMAVHGIKGSVPQEQFDHYLIVTEHEKDVKAAVGFQSPDDAYLALLGPDGVVRWTFHGPVSDDPIRQIRDKLR